VARGAFCYTIAPSHLPTEGDPAMLRPVEKIRVLLTNRILAALPLD
jgi:hypothetical protein